jgi:hypothetical protein
VSCLPDQLSAIRQQPATGRSTIEGPGPPSTRCRTGGPTLRAPSMRSARVEPEKPARAHSGSAPRRRSGRHLRGERPAQSPAPKETTRRLLRPPLRVTTRGTHASRHTPTSSPNPLELAGREVADVGRPPRAVLDPKRQPRNLRSGTNPPQLGNSGGRSDAGGGVGTAAARTGDPAPSRARAPSPPSQLASNAAAAITSGADRSRDRSARNPSRF